jgi:hypothetical protein
MGGTAAINVFYIDVPLMCYDVQNSENNEKSGRASFRSFDFPAPPGPCPLPLLPGRGVAVSKEVSISGRGDTWLAC